MTQQPDEVTGFVELEDDSRIVVSTTTTLPDESHSFVGHQSVKLIESSSESIVPRYNRRLPPDCESHFVNQSSGQSVSQSAS